MSKKKDLLARENFKVYIGNIFYFRRFSESIPSESQYEICLEPCRFGFDVALYRLYKSDAIRKIVTKKICTNEPNYLEDRLNERIRTDETWDHALEIARAMLTSYFEEGLNLKTNL